MNRKNIKLFLLTFLSCVLLNINVSASEGLSIDEYNPETGCTITEYAADASITDTYPGSAGTLPTPRQIIGSDNRVVISNTTKAPYRYIGELVVTYGSKTSIGTGFLVNNSVVVTAAHCVEGTPDKVTFYPGKNGGTNPYGSANVKKIRIPSAYNSSPEYQKKYDYAVLELDKPLGKTVGYFGLHNSSFQDPTKIFAIAGYNTNNKMYRHSGNLTVSNDLKTLNYTIDTLPGQSGSPIYYKDGSSYTVSGIHCGSVGSLNYGKTMEHNIFIMIEKAIVNTQ